MRIQHNIMAMNAYRNYNTNTSALSKNLEKLSSGYKIKDCPVRFTRFLLFQPAARTG